jgi:hypothetical protein
LERSNFTGKPTSISGMRNLYSSLIEPDNGAAQEESTMLTQIKSILVTGAAILTMTVAATSANAAEAKTMSGRWIMPDNSILVIRGSDWFHPGKGAGTISRKAGNTFRVEYNSHQGTGCTYRANTTAGGDVLVLEAADATQSTDFCPSGRFSRSD